MSTHDPSPLIPIEKKKFLCIEYPGYVKRLDRAMKTMGGESAISEALSNNDQVQLRYRAKDIFSHPINGDILNTCKLLVKVTRRVKRNKITGEVVEEAQDEPWKPEILGIVQKTVRFRSLADFQYIVPENDKMRHLKEALDIGDVDQIVKYRIPNDDDDFENLRNIPPPAFTPIETPFNYGYKQSSPVVRVRVRQPDGSFIIKLLNRSKTSGRDITAIKYDDENVPTKSWHHLREPGTDIEIESIEAVAALFKERPIWSRFALRHNLDVKYHRNLTYSLVHSAYTFYTGPWRDCWVVYGLDPRKDPKYNIYQQVDIRRIVKEGHSRKIITRRDNPTKFRERSSKPIVPELVPNQNLFDGKIIPGSSSMYQICDIVDPDLTPLIGNDYYLKQYPTKYTGFFYKCVFERLRSSMKQKYVSLLDTGVAAPIRNIEDGLLYEISREIKEQKENAVNEDGYEVEAEDDDNPNTQMAEFEKAAREAMNTMDRSGEGSNKRLQQVADDYIDQLSSVDTTMANDLDDIVDLDMLDTLEEFDEELDDEEEGDSQQPVIDEDAQMKD